MTRKVSAYALPMAIFAALALAVMRFATHALPYGIPSGLLSSLETFPEAFLAAPFGIDFESGAVLASGAAAFLVPLSWALAVARSQRNRYAESGRQHGEERMADGKEMRAFADTKDFANNIWYTKSCGLLLKARNKRQKSAQYAVNLNCIVYATSGSGKTFNLTKPSFLQSVGDHLRPVPPSPLRILEHVFPARAAKGADRPALGRAKRRMAARRTINDGYDVFNTDPKGDNVRDVGPLYEAAGYEIKCFNTIDPSASLHYNPFANIETRLIDIKDTDDLKCSVRLAVDGEEVSRELEGASRITVNAERAGLLSADVDVEHDEATCVGAAEGIADAEERKRALEDIDWVEKALGDKVAGAVKGFSYRRSRVRVRVTWRNTDWRDRSPVIDVRLDPALEVTSLPATAEIDPESNTVTWRPGTVFGRPKGARDEEACVVSLEIEAHVKPMRVPDGVSLAKNINCMCKNLNEEVQASGDSKFWEDTKQLAFMSYVALLFEKYEPEYRNIPEMMRLLNMAVVDEDPSALSELDVLMEAWETGFIFLPDESSEGSELSLRDRRKGGSWQPAGNDPHDRSRSLAVHCYKAYNVGAVETRQSVLASCQAAMVRMVPEGIQELVRYDEMHLETLGEANQRQVIFAIPDAVDDTYSFLFALMTFQAMSLFCDRAVKKHGGRAPRHVRFEIDEAGTIGKITLLDRIIAVIRSFNGSIALYFQSKAQAVKTYGKEGADIIIDCCTTTLFMGSQQDDTLGMIESMIGEETVTAATLQRTYDACGFAQNASESVSANARKVRSKAQLRREEKTKMLAFILGMRPVLDYKFPTQMHPLYCWIDPDSPRGLTQPVCRAEGRFDYQAYRERRRREEEAEER